jgi:hypothetical protein
MRAHYRPSAVPGLERSRPAAKTGSMTPHCLLFLYEQHRRSALMNERYAKARVEPFKISGVQSGPGAISPTMPPHPDVQAPAGQQHPTRRALLEDLEPVFLYFRRETSNEFAKPFVQDRT